MMIRTCIDKKRKNSKLQSTKENLCLWIEYELCLFFEKQQEDKELKGFWCDGISPEYLFSPNENNTIQTTCWIGKDGQDKYTLFLYLSDGLCTRKKADYDAIISRAQITNVSVNRSNRRVDVTISPA